MVTTYKKLRAQEWTWSGSGFTRQTPSEKQLAAPKPSLVYKRARYYHPGLGQFISRDPLGYVDGMSLYRGYFVPGATDPTGRTIKSACDISDFLDQYLAGSYLHFDSHNYVMTGAIASGALEKQILSAMMSEVKVFEVKGTSKKQIVANLTQHIEARKTIVNNALSKQLGFGRADLGWQRARIEETGASGPQEVWDAINVPEGSLMCNNYTNRIFETGTLINGDTKSASRKRLYWIPGDWGYIKNESNNSIGPKWAAGLEGENIISVGGRKFWGHITRSQTVFTMDEWFDYMKKWKSEAEWIVVGSDLGMHLQRHRESGSPKLNPDVKYPTVGLK